MILAALMSGKKSSILTIQNAGTELNICELSEMTYRKSEEITQEGMAVFSAFYVSASKDELFS